MATFILTLLPAVLTFAVATWNSPTDEARRHSAATNHASATRCRC